MNDPFLLDYHANVFLLGLALYREAAGEPDLGKVAVAHVIVTRAEHPSWKGDDLYSVITCKEQFSSISHLGDPMTVCWPKLADRVFRRCLQIAEDVYLGRTANPAPGADHYCTVAVAAHTKWVDERRFVIQIGAHRFYNLDGNPAVAKEAT